MSSQRFRKDLVALLAKNELPSAPGSPRDARWIAGTSDWWVQTETGWYWLRDGRTWVYKECRAAAEAFDEGVLDDSEENDGDVHAYADSRVDVYTKALYEWAADFCLTETWSAAEQEAKDMGLPEETTKRIAFIQYAAIRHIADTMRGACIAATKATAEASA